MSILLMVNLILVLKEFYDIFKMVFNQIKYHNYNSDSDSDSDIEDLDFYI